MLEDVYADMSKGMIPETNWCRARSFGVIVAVRLMICFRLCIGIMTLLGGRTIYLLVQTSADGSLGRCGAGLRSKCGIIISVFVPAKSLLDGLFHLLHGVAHRRFILLLVFVEGFPLRLVPVKHCVAHAG